MPVTPRFLAIRASAGSGKTFQLAHRYIRLLSEGVSPDEIAALTFTRKAAGEIFDAITDYVSTACLSDRAATETTARLGTGAPQMTAHDYVTMLRRLLEGMHRLHIGTIDSFAVKVVKSFPLELGVPSTFELMEGDDAATQSFRRHILDQMFTGGATGADRRRLLSAFEQARTGRSGKGVEEPLSDFIAAYQEHYRVLPQEDRWGEPSAIWPHGSPWLEPIEDVHEAAAAFRACLTPLGLTDAHHERFCDFADAVACHTPYSRWDGALKYMMEKLLACAEGLLSGHGTVKLNRTEYELTGDAAIHALALMRYVIATELKAAMARTRGIYHVVDMYDALYDEAARREGRLTFADVQHLLTGHGTRGEGAALTGSATAADEASRLYIDYRLDSHLRHWLLDEFQDTSDLQWDVLGNLADEVLQDDTGLRSFFYVGDVKQAIYGWRGGNPDLFDMLLARYPLIEQDVLQLSRRSTQPVIDMVNKVFAEVPGEPDLPQGLAARWRFEEHTTIHTDNQAGCAMLIEPPCNDGDLKPQSEDRYRVAAGLLRGIDPTRRQASTDDATPLTAAVLVRTNSQGKAVVDLLRRECPGMTIIHEGRAAIRDNPVVVVLLSLVTLAAHPGNTLAWRHLQMSPLAQAPGNDRLIRDSLARRLLRHIQAHGFESLLRYWGSRIDSVANLDAYGRKRLGELLAAATEFDATGSRDCDEFLDFIENYELHEQAADDAVRVMTVHQAKGLEFDVVILPELDDRLSMARARDASFALARHPMTNEPLWALELPRLDVSEADPTLAAQVAKIQEDAALESLCLLYVAMTRAKRALYVITSYPGKTSSSFTQSAFLKRQLTCETKPTESDGSPYNVGGSACTRLHATGNVNWYESLPAVEPTPEQVEAPAAPAETAPTTHRRLVAVRPSDADDAEKDAAALFDESRRMRRELGSAVHSLLQGIEWLQGPDSFTPPAIPAGTDEELWKNAVLHVRSALSTPDVAALFQQPDEPVTLWRERRFEVVRGEEWITGAFDRVVIRKNQDGRPVHAVIYDFKTDDIRGSAAVSARSGHYAPQMRTYRDVLSHMLGLRTKNVSLFLVFTSAGAVRSIE
ncbi:MAG: UvrD-helicase domain-containing protein [Chloroflexota bacterium]